MSNVIEKLKSDTDTRRQQAMAEYRELVRTVAADKVPKGTPDATLEAVGKTIEDLDRDAAAQQERARWQAMLRDDIPRSRDEAKRLAAEIAAAEAALERAVADAEEAIRALATDAAKHGAIAQREIEIRGRLVRSCRNAELVAAHAELAGRVADAEAEVKAARRSVDFWRGPAEGLHPSSMRDPEELAARQRHAEGKLTEARAKLSAAEGELARLVEGLNRIADAMLWD